MAEETSIAFVCVCGAEEPPSTDEAKWQKREYRQMKPNGKKENI